MGLFLRQDREGLGPQPHQQGALFCLEQTCCPEPSVPGSLCSFNWNFQN